MLRFILITLALYAHLGPLMERPPDLHGLSTWYGPPAFRQGDTMANGEPLRLAGATVAVDASRAAWLGRDAFVLTECGGLHKVRVTDTGRLYDAGFFRLGVRSGILRYWPVTDIETELEPVVGSPILEAETEWLEVGVYRVVADFPRDFFAARVACETDVKGRGETTKVWLWIIDGR